MSYAALFVGILIIVLVVIAAYHALSTNTPQRTLLRDEQGKLVAVGERERAAGHLSGRGSQTSDTLQLTRGAYRIDYQFDALTRLALLDLLDGSDDTLLIKSGAGTEGFTLESDGRYRFLIEPTDESASWQIIYYALATRSPTQGEVL